MLYDTDTSRKFSGREDNYHKYRPDYPEEMIGFLYKELGLNKNSVIADIGSGTGILTQHFIKRGNKTYGIEINTDMRRKAEENFEDVPQFISIDGSAENTTLAKKSIDLITSAQAFHWFKPEPTSKEFKRILKPNGHAALIWNVRQTENNPFLEAYDNLLKEHCPRYHQKGQYNYINNENISTIFGTAEPKLKEYDNAQHSDLKILFGRALSMSYVDADNQPLFQNLKSLFNEHNKNGQVTFLFKTRVLYGQLSI